MNPIVQDVKNRIYKKGENCLIVVVGPTRIGKSIIGGLTLGKMIDPTFNVKDCMTFEIEEFYDSINNDNFNHKVVVIEEMGLKADKRRFMSLQNKILTYTFQTFAYKQFCVIMTVPSMSFIDSRIEHLITYVFEGKKATKQNQKLIKTLFKLKRYSHNPVLGKTYKKNPRFWVDGRKVVLSSITMHVPDEGIIQEYRALEKAYKDKLSRELVNEIKVEAPDEDKNSLSDKEIIQEVLDNKEKFITKYLGKPHISSTTLKAFFNLSRHKSLDLSKILNEKIKDTHIQMANCA
jgi:hypothetical protein